MKTVHTIKELRAFVKDAKASGKTVGFVPTMGNLHEGHLSLIDVAKSKTDVVVSSIFVNPMQFGENEDLDAYPRTLEQDQSHLQNRGCDLLFAPNAHEVYPNGIGSETRVKVPDLSEHHCGASRPGHFEGVATVVTKLFNMVQPDVAVFGEKDFQQLAVIRKMTIDLCMPIDVIGVPTSREESGLARSSRNGYLTADEKDKASLIYRVLTQCRDVLKDPDYALANTLSDAIKSLEDGGFKIDYFNIANPLTLAPAKDDDKELVILVAAWMGTTRLIDNITVKRGL